MWQHLSASSPRQGVVLRGVWGVGELWTNREARRGREVIMGSTVPCEHCGKSIYRNPYRLSHFQHQFCDRRCRGDWRASQRAVIQATGAIEGRTKDGCFAPITGKTRYRVSQRNGRRMTAQRAVWIDAYGTIPRGYYIHHKDKNPRNNALDNLLAVTITEHNRIHAHSPWNKGLTVGSSVKLAEAHKTKGLSKTMGKYPMFIQARVLDAMGVHYKAIASVSDVVGRQVHDYLQKENVYVF